MNKHKYLAGKVSSFQSVWNTKEKKKERELYHGQTQQILSQQIKHNNSDVTLKLRIYVQWEIYLVFRLAPDTALELPLKFF